MRLPSYIGVRKKGILKRRIRCLKELARSCALCPRMCGVNRLDDAKGFCGAGRDVYVSSINLHHGEEPPISGIKGSGTIFFTSCNMRCVYCQNYPISQLRKGNRMSVEDIGKAMLSLQSQGAHNVNLVTPTHVSFRIIEALDYAIERGFCIPLVYNTGGYERVETLKLLEGIVDIYLPDAKYSDNDNAVRYSQAPGYTEYNRKALAEMARQAGLLRLNRDGVAYRGLIIRHLVLPDNIAGSMDTFHFITSRLGKDVYVSLMAQYHPAHCSASFESLGRRVTREEYTQALLAFTQSGLHNGWQQEL